MFNFNNIQLLVEGQLKYVGDGRTISHSNVVLVKDEKNLIIDTGFVGDNVKIIKALKKQGLTPEDIDYVIITHKHLDHTLNAYLFQNAEIYAENWWFNMRDGVTREADSSDIKKIPPFMKLIKTPGHTQKHRSVLFKTDRGNVVITGDAIPSENFIDIKKTPREYWDLAQFNNSREHILEIADWIIPGHGKMIKI
jgi:glyoxylase-like metal-dependent hydrolase (beta-lactamase superfamily II)